MSDSKTTVSAEGLKSAIEDCSALMARWTERYGLDSFGASWHPMWEMRAQLERIRDAIRLENAKNV